MREYSNGEFNEEQDDLETKFYEKDESNDEVLENEFEPYDEEQETNKGFFDTYVPKDEQESNIGQFETEFIPKDESSWKESKKSIQEDRKRTSKEVGDISEMHIMKDLLNQGRNVLLPYGDNQRYDFLLEENNQLHRVQVKTGKEYKNNKLGVYGVQSYIGEIEYLGVFRKNDNKRFLVPIEYFRDKKYDFEINQFELGSESLSKHSVKNKLDDINTRIVELHEQGYTVLNQLGISNKNMIYFEQELKERENNIKHLVRKHSFKKNKGEDTFQRINHELELARVKISSDLMLKGGIISSPFSKELNYDFVFQDKYNKINPITQSQKEASINQFYTAKLLSSQFIDGKFEIEYDINERIDYFAIYDSKRENSYLIPSQDLKSGIKHIKPYEMKENDNILNKMNASDRGEAIEMKIASDFIKHGYKVYTPIVGRRRYDLIINREGKFYTVQVKTGRPHFEKDSKYISFEIATKKSKTNKELIDYHGEIDFFATVNKENLKSYIIPVEKLPHSDAK